MSHQIEPMDTRRILNRAVDVWSDLAKEDGGGEYILELWCDELEHLVRSVSSAVIEAIPR